MPTILKRTKHQTLSPADLGLSGPAAELVEQHRVSLEHHADKAFETFLRTNADDRLSHKGKAAHVALAAEAAVQDVIDFNAKQRKALDAQLAKAREQLPSSLPSLSKVVQQRYAEAWSPSPNASADANSLRKSVLAGDMIRLLADDLRELRAELAAMDAPTREGVVMAAAVGTDARSLDVLLAAAHDPRVNRLVPAGKVAEATERWLEANYPEPFAEVASVKDAIRLFEQNTNTVLRAIQREAGLPVLGELQDTISLDARPPAAPTAAAGV